jgi:hypothetical protein
MRNGAADRRHSRHFEVETIFADLLDAEQESLGRWLSASDGLRTAYLRWISGACSRRMGYARAVLVVDWLRSDAECGPVQRVTSGRSAMLWGPF